MSIDFVQVGSVYTITPPIYVGRVLGSFFSVSDSGIITIYTKDMTVAQTIRDIADISNGELHWKRICTNKSEDSVLFASDEGIVVLFEFDNDITHLHRVFYFDSIDGVASSRMKNRFYIAGIYENEHRVFTIEPKNDNVIPNEPITEDAPMESFDETKEGVIVQVPNAKLFSLDVYQNKCFGFKDQVIEKESLKTGNKIKIKTSDLIRVWPFIHKSFLFYNAKLQYMGVIYNPKDQSGSFDQFESHCILRNPTAVALTCHNQRVYAIYNDYLRSIRCLLRSKNHIRQPAKHHKTFILDETNYIHSNQYGSILQCRNFKAKNDPTLGLTVGDHPFQLTTEGVVDLINGEYLGFDCKVMVHGLNQGNGAVLLENQSLCLFKGVQLVDTHPVKLFGTVTAVNWFDDRYIIGIVSISWSNVIITTNGAVESLTFKMPSQVTQILPYGSERRIAIALKCGSVVILYADKCESNYALDYIYFSDKEITLIEDPRHEGFIISAEDLLLYRNGKFVSLVDGDGFYSVCLGASLLASKSKDGVCEVFHEQNEIEDTFLADEIGFCHAYKTLLHCAEGKVVFEDGSHLSGCKCLSSGLGRFVLGEETDAELGVHFGPYEITARHCTVYVQGNKAQILPSKIIALRTSHLFVLIFDEEGSVVAVKPTSTLTLEVVARYKNSGQVTAVTVLDDITFAIGDDNGVIRILRVLRESLIGVTLNPSFDVVGCFNARSPITALSSENDTLVYATDDGEIGCLLLPRDSRDFRILNEVQTEARNIHASRYNVNSQNRRGYASQCGVVDLDLFDSIEKDLKQWTVIQSLRRVRHQILQ